MFTNEVIVAVISLVFCFITYILFKLHKNINECVSLYKELLTILEKNYNFLDDKFSKQIKNIRTNDFDIKEYNSMKEICKIINDNGHIESLEDLISFMEDMNDFDLKDKVSNIEYLVEKWQDVDDIEHNISDLNDRVEEMNENMSKFVLEDDVIELIGEHDNSEETDKRINQMEKFIKNLKTAINDWE